MANLVGAILPISLSSGTQFNSRLGTDFSILISTATQFNSRFGIDEALPCGLSKWFGGRKTIIIKLGGDVTTIIMQAKDSITGTVYVWPVNEPDFAGIYYPGPNTPIQIAISEIRTSEISP